MDEVEFFDTGVMRANAPGCGQLVTGLVYEIVLPGLGHAGRGGLKGEGKGFGFPVPEIEGLTGPAREFLDGIEKGFAIGLEQSLRDGGD